MEVSKMRFRWLERGETEMSFFEFCLFGIEFYLNKITLGVLFKEWTEYPL